MSYAPQPSYPAPHPPKSGSNALVIVLVILVVVVFFVGILAVMAISGVRRYIANAKTAEARNSVRAIAVDARAAYETDGRLCPSASQPVPAVLAEVRGKKYLSRSSEWEVDEAKNAGFACIHFSLATPQYYQYDYKVTGDSFEALAHGDLDGNGIASTFASTGRVVGTTVLTDPTIRETNPTE